MPAPTTTTVAPIATFCHIFMTVASFSCLSRPPLPQTLAIVLAETLRNTEYDRFYLLIRPLWAKCFARAAPRLTRPPEHDLTPQNPVSGNRMQGTCHRSASHFRNNFCEKISLHSPKPPELPSSLDARRWPGVVRKSVKILYQKRLSRPIFLALGDTLCAWAHLSPAPTAERW